MPGDNSAIIPGNAELLSLWWTAIKAEREICEEPPFKPEDVILHYCGCGASFMVTAADLDAACALIESELSRRQAGRESEQQPANPETNQGT